MIARARIVEAARAYIGTPFVHQGRVRGVGIDCAGLVIEVARKLNIRSVEINGYGRQPDQEQFRRLCHQYMVPIAWEEVEAGDVLTFAFIREQHLAIVAERDPMSIVHAYESARRCVEQPLDRTWINRLRGCYRFPEA
jgi:NlpC/P60 family putative phage cell wall peptidase